MFISVFVEQKDTKATESAELTWMCDFAFLIDVMAGLFQSAECSTSVTNTSNDLSNQYILSTHLLFRDDSLAVEDATANANYFHGKQARKYEHV